MAERAPAPTPGRVLAVLKKADVAFTLDPPGSVGVPPWSNVPGLKLAVVCPSAIQVAFSGEVSTRARHPETFAAQLRLLREASRSRSRRWSAAPASGAPSSPRPTTRHAGAD
jgi:hypothetical protein